MTDENMIEKVAEAMYEKLRAETAFEGCEDSPWPQIDKTERDLSLRIARAAIEAMQNPTEEMLQAGWDADEPSFCDEPGSSAGPDGHWQAMIDAALKNNC